MADTENKSTLPPLITSRKIIIIIFLLLVFFMAMAGGWFASYYWTSAPKQSEASAVVLIPPGSSVKDIAGILARAGLINDDFRFLVLAKISGLAPKLPAGEFSLPTGVRPITVLQQLAIATPVLHSFTVPEGWNISEIASFLNQNGFCPGDEFERLSRDTEFIDSLGLGGMKTLEGYLFPDTYFISRDDFDAARIIRVLISRFKNVWQDLAHDLPASMNRHEVVILASMIEKETGAAEERARIAGVFLNRLDLGMRLQSDPTVIYGIDGFTGSLTRKDLQTASSYNTYTLAGLPAGPICSPGRDALLAVLHPEKHEYLYFVSRNDGTHEFSKNLREHNRAVQKYQRKN